MNLLFILTNKIHSIIFVSSKFWIIKINMIRAILSRCSFRFSSFNIIFFCFEIITCRNCLKIDDDLMKAINFVRVWIVDFVMSSSILNLSLYLTFWFTMKIESTIKLKVVTSKFWTFFAIDELIWTFSLKDELIMILMIIIKIFYIILHDLFINRLFDNTLNVIIDRFNDSFFHFSCFENVIL